MRSSNSSTDLSSKYQISKWTSNICALMAVDLGNQPRDILVRRDGDSARCVILDSKIESIICLTHLNLFEYDWLQFAINIGWTNMQKEALDEFLNIVPNRTWFYLKCRNRGKTTIILSCFFIHLLRRGRR